MGSGQHSSRWPRKGRTSFGVASIDQSVPALRALQDGGHSHACKHAPPPRLDDQDRPLRLLHASVYSRGRPQVLPLHVQRHKIRMCGHTLRPCPGTSHRNQVFAASDQVPRRRGVRCTVYIDDIIILARSRVQSLKHTQLAVDLLHSLGFGIHPDKLQGVPRQSVEFLGFQVNSVKMQFRVPQHKIRDLRR